MEVGRIVVLAETRAWRSRSLLGSRRWSAGFGVVSEQATGLIGHDSEAIHQVYVSVAFEALKKAADALPDVT